MKLYSPAYYSTFKCIADRCRHSCCVGWEISVDPSTMKRYREMGEAGREILSHIDCEDGLIMLDEERCPFLDDRGLCKIISSYGEDAVSDMKRSLLFVLLTDSLSSSTADRGCIIFATAPILFSA